MNYDNRRFRARLNSDNGEVGQDTRFTYHQSGNRLWGEYSGGEITCGHLQGKVHADGRLEFLYHHENRAGELMAGKCLSTPGTDANGRLVLKERWSWFTGDRSSGCSEIEEISDDS
jgi:hypothetical protein